MRMERMRHSENGAVNPAVWTDIKALEDRAHDVYLSYVRKNGQVIGENYVARITQGALLEEDVREYVDPANDCFVTDIATGYSSKSIVFDMVTGRGVLKEKLFTRKDTEYFELDSACWRNQGSKLLRELFEPGSHPELSALALASREQLVCPEDLPARIMTPEEYKSSGAVARLGRFTLEHMTEILQLYGHVAYPAGIRPYLRADEMGYNYRRLLEGERVGLRRGTVNLDCAKQELHPSVHDDTLHTSLYLNYDIPIGPVKLYFREDIDMAVEYGRQARAYFETEGIAVS